MRKEELTPELVSSIITDSCYQFSVRNFTRVPAELPTAASEKSEQSPTHSYSKLPTSPMMATLTCPPSLCSIPSPFLKPVREPSSPRTLSLDSCCLSRQQALWWWQSPQPSPCWSMAWHHHLRLRYCRCRSCHS